MRYAKQASLFIIWNLAKARCRHTDAVLSVVFHPTEDAILSSSVDTTVRLWRIDPLDEVIRWTCANRYVPTLTPEQRAKYGMVNASFCA